MCEQKKHKCQNVFRRKTDEFKYLSRIISSEKNFKKVNKDDANNIKKGAGFYHQVRHLLWNQQIPHKTKLLMFNYTPI